MKEDFDRLPLRTPKRYYCSTFYGTLDAGPVNGVSLAQISINPSDDLLSLRTDVRYGSRQASLL